MSSAHSHDGEAARSAAQDALRRARRELAGGSVDHAWDECLIAAAIGRALGDVKLVAEAAMLIPGPQVASHHLTTARLELCVEALGMPMDADSPLRLRLEHYLAGLTGGWTVPPTTPRAAVSTEEADGLLLELRAEHAAALAPADTEHRLEIATRLRDIARAVHRDDDVAWGMLWRLDALAQLGRRIELITEFIELVGIVRRRDSPHWRWRIATIRASLALLDDHIDDVPPLAAEALRLGSAAGVEEAAFIDLIVRSYLARRTGEGLEGIEAEVRRALADAPFIAQGWRADVLVALGRVDEAMEIWRALAPHLDEVPATALEWLVAATGHAELSILAQDRAAAAHVYDMLSPHAHLHVMPSAMTPYDGPVSMYLGELAAFLGRPAIARAHFDDALTRSQEMHAPAYSRRTRAAITLLDRSDSPAPNASPLSPREAEVAELVGAGMTNREVARQLFLSERTVENHVSSILRRLELPNRAAVAAWVSRRRPA